VKASILDIQKLKKFSDENYHKETIWSDKYGRINLICMKPGQEIITHTHHGNHIWIVMEGRGEFISGGEWRVIDSGKIVIVPPLVEHGIRNAEKEDLIIASIAGKGD
jgi:quercetin dioxygenase-like cupin family protein